MKTTDLRVGDLVSIMREGFGGVSAYYMGEFSDENTLEQPDKLYTFYKPGSFQIGLTEHCIKEKKVQFLLIKREEE